jgi:hypothetical protein
MRREAGCCRRAECNKTLFRVDVLSVVGTLLEASTPCAE